MKPGTLLRLAVAGTRTDTIRVVLTALSAALAAIALLAAATVAAIDSPSVQYLPDGGYLENNLTRYTSALLNEAGLRPGVLIALLLLALPVLALAGQCIRLGAPGRDRRLAAIRLAGATPGQAVLIASAETAVASLIGAVAGFGGFLALRAALHDPRQVAVGWSGEGPMPPPQTVLPLPTDILPAAWVIVFVVLTIPVLSGAIGALLLRQVIVTPLGVERRTRDRSPKPWPGVLIALGIGLFAFATQLGERLHVSPDASMIVMGAGVVLTMAGVVLGTGWISYTTGRVMLRLGRRPSTLLAARRLLADPWNGSRTFAALLVGIIAGAIALGYRMLMETEFASYDRLNALMNTADGSGAGAAEDPSFYLNAVDLIMVTVAVAMTVAAAGVLIALVESVVARRRTQVALTAAGVPARTLSAAVLWHTMAPLIPAVLVSLAVGLSITRLLGTEVREGGGSYDSCTGTEAQCASGDPAFVERIVQPEVVLSVPVPYEGLALLGGGAVLAMLLVVAIGVLVQQRGTNVEELRVG